jgi:hypothetical protein
MPKPLSSTAREEQLRGLVSALAMLVSGAAFACGSSNRAPDTEGAAGTGAAGAGAAGGTAGVGAAGGTAGANDGGTAGSSAGRGGDGFGGSAGESGTGGSGAGAEGGAAGGEVGGAAGAAAGGSSSGGAGMDTGGAGSGGDAGSGGAPASECPAEMPVDDMPCPSSLEGATCYYDDCEGLGSRSRASCPARQPGDAAEPAWAVSTFPCGVEVECGGNASAQTCPIGEVCLVMEGGAPIGQCAEHSCGTGPIQCDCVEGCFDGCYPLITDQGVTFACNTCSEPICA